MSLLGPPNPAVFAAVFEGPNSERLQAVDVPHQVQNTSEPTPCANNFRALSRFASSNIPEIRHSRAPILAPGLSAASHGPHNHKQRGCLLVPLLYRFSHDHELDQVPRLGPAVVPLALSLLLPPCLHPPLLRNASCSTTERGLGSSSYRNPHPRRFRALLSSARQIRHVLIHRLSYSPPPNCQDGTTPGHSQL